MKGAAFVSALCLLTACEGTTIVDDWGPPAGYTVVHGRVLTPAGAPFKGVEISVSRCTEPSGGFLGVTFSDSVGYYRVVGSLPPVGLMIPRPAIDSIEVRCLISVNRQPPRDTVTVRFRANLSDAPVQSLDLRYP